MKLFLDAADPTELEAALVRGLGSGITTNPILIARATDGAHDEHLRTIITLVRRHGLDLPLSVGIFAPKVGDMLSQAERVLEQFADYEQLVIKIPIGWDELEVMVKLKQRGARVNCTCCVSYNQVLLAAQANVDYASLLWGRIRDQGYDAASVVQQLRRSFEEGRASTEILVASVRQPIDVNEAFQAGAHIVTVPPKLLPQLCAHSTTTEAVAQFRAKYAPPYSAQAMAAVVAAAAGPARG